MIGTVLQLKLDNELTEENQFALIGSVFPITIEGRSFMVKALDISGLVVRVQLIDIEPYVN